MNLVHSCAASRNLAVASLLSKPINCPMPPRSSGFIAPCIPTHAPKPPTGPGWVHEIKHDGYRLQVRREGDMVRLFTRRGYDWSDRYPAIAVTATLLRARSFTLDGEAVVCGPDGVAIFDALHRRGTVSEARCWRQPADGIRRRARGGDWSTTTL
jgi:ATP-dependent DNA ligase